MPPSTELAELRYAGPDAQGWLVLAVGLVIGSLSAFVAIGGPPAHPRALLGLALRRLPGIYRRGIARERGDRMARLRSGRQSHKQDQLNSDGIPEFLDFFSRGTGVRIHLPPTESQQTLGPARRELTQPQSL